MEIKLEDLTKAELLTLVESKSYCIKDLDIVNVRIETLRDEADALYQKSKSEKDFWKCHAIFDQYVSACDRAAAMHKKYYGGAS